MSYHFLQAVLRLNCVGSIERKTQRSCLTRQREPVGTRLSRHTVGMRDGIDQVRSDLFAVDQLAARSNFGSSGWQLFCARLRQHLIGQSKIIRRAAVTRRDPHTCCGQNGVTRPGSASFFLGGIHHRRLFSVRRCHGLIGTFAHESASAFRVLQIATRRATSLLLIPSSAARVLWRRGKSRTCSSKALTLSIMSIFEEY